MCEALMFRALQLYGYRSPPWDGELALSPDCLLNLYWRSDCVGLGSRATWRGDGPPGVSGVTLIASRWCSAAYQVVCWEAFCSSRSVELRESTGPASSLWIGWRLCGSSESGETCAVARNLSAPAG